MACTKVCSSFFHAQKSYPSQSFAHQHEARRSEEEEKRDMKDRGQESQRLMERKVAQQNKNIFEKLIQGLPSLVLVYLA